MDRISCVECRQCNHKGKPSVGRFSKYYDDNYIHRVKSKKSLFSWFTNIKDKFFEKRAKYNKDGSLKELDKKGFRESWFYR